MACLRNTSLVAQGSSWLRRGRRGHKVPCNITMLVRRVSSVPVLANYYLFRYVCFAAPELGRKLIVCSDARPLHAQQEHSIQQEHNVCTIAKIFNKHYISPTTHCIISYHIISRILSILYDFAQPTKKKIKKARNSNLPNQQKTHQRPLPQPPQPPPKPRPNPPNQLKPPTLTSHHPTPHLYMRTSTQYMNFPRPKRTACLVLRTLWVMSPKTHTTMTVSRTLKR